MAKTTGGGASGRRGKIIFGAIAVAAVAAIVAALSFYLSNANRTHYSTSDTSSTITALDCKAVGLESPFFSDTNAVAVEHNIRVMLDGGDVSQISYTYTGQFADNEAAEQAEARLHAKYNTYMGEHGLSKDLLSVFSGTNGNQYTLRIIGDKEDINSTTEKIFYLEDFKNNRTYDAESFSKAYAKIGFTCKNSD